MSAVLVVALSLTLLAIGPDNVTILLFLQYQSHFRQIVDPHKTPPPPPPTTGKKTPKPKTKKPLVEKPETKKKKSSTYATRYSVSQAAARHLKIPKALSQFYRFILFWHYP